MLKNKFSQLTLVEIFIFIFIASIVVFIVKFYTFKSETRIIRVEIIKKNWVENYDPNGYRAPYWLNGRLKIGQIQRSLSGQNQAEIINIDSYPKNSQETELYLTLNVKIVTSRDGSITFQDKPIIVGSNIELYFNNTLLVGQILDDNVPIQGYPTKTVVVTFRARNLDPWYVNKIKVGNKMTNLSTNDTVAEIISLKFESSSINPVNISSNNQLLQTDNSNSKDVIMTVKLKVKQFGNQWIFNDRYILKSTTNPNDRITLYLENLNLYDLEIEDVNSLL